MYSILAVIVAPSFQRFQIGRKHRHEQEGTVGLGLLE